MAEISPMVPGRNKIFQAHAVRQPFVDFSGDQAYLWQVIENQLLPVQGGILFRHRVRVGHLNYPVQFGCCSHVMRPPLRLAVFPEKSVATSPPRFSFVQIFRDLLPVAKKRDGQLRANHFRRPRNRATRLRRYA